MKGVNYSSVAWGDYDNDGDLDILLTGCKEGPYCRTSKIYRNNGDGTFTEQTSINLTGVYNGSVAWGDYDNDGDLDILLTGRVEGNGNYVSKIYRNNSRNSNTVPSAPTGLSSSTSNDTVTLSWSAASDGQTPQSGLTYNLRVGTSPGGCEVISPMSNPSTGYRRTVKMGNANQNTSWTIKNLSAGTYYWSVQAIDNGFMGSAFATEQTFEITMTNLSLSQSATPPPYAKATPAPAQTPTTSLVVYMRGTNNAQGFAAFGVSDERINAGTIYNEGATVYGDVAVRIEDTVYHFDPDPEPGEPEQLPDPYRVEFKFSDSLIAATEGMQPGFNPQKAQFWVGTLNCNSAMPSDKPYRIEMTLYAGGEARRHTEISFFVVDDPLCGSGSEESDECDAPCPVRE